MKILFMFQALLKRLKLKNNSPCLLINRHDSDRLLNNLLDSSVSDKDTLRCASTELIVDIFMRHLSSHSPLEPYYLIESAECAVKTVSLLSSLSLSLLSVQQYFMGLLEEIFLETPTTLLSPEFFRNVFHCNQSPAADDHVISSVSAFREDSVQLDEDADEEDERS